jgi:hypothetical protein
LSGIPADVKTAEKEESRNMNVDEYFIVAVKKDLRH